MFDIYPFLSLLGYPQLLSGDLTNLANVAGEFQDFYFPDDITDEPHTKTTRVKRYPLQIPMYPFRTLNARELVRNKIAPGEFDIASPLIPAHTQLNMTFKRRKNVTNFHPFMLPQNLNVLAGSQGGTLNDGQYNTATCFTVSVPGENAAAEPVIQRYRITAVNVVLVDAYLQVRNKEGGRGGWKGTIIIIVCVQVLRLKYKSISPERPMSNIFTAYRSVFTPLQRVSLHQYAIIPDPDQHATCAYFSFVK